MNEFLGSLEEQMKNIPDGCATMVFADLPYGTTKCKWDSLVDLDIFWEECWRVLKPNGVVVCTAQFPFTAILSNSQLKYLRYDWTWEKTQATGYQNAKTHPMKAHENVLVFYKKLPKYNPQKTKGHVRKVSKAENRNRCIQRRIEVHGDDYLYGKETGAPTYDSTERYPRSVIKFAKDVQKLALHRTQKPEGLLEYFVNTYTDEGDIVVDPARGSNTTGVVCDRLNRGYYGIEKDPIIFEQGLERRKNQINLCN